jgi:16S rRNA (guanine966-N2)-methyltransferase
MRVVAGEFKGRRLHAPRGRGTRPTADKVREAVFSILGDVAGLQVLDLYAGSGALGIEALSRGASEAVFVEADARAVAAIRRNLDPLPVSAAVHRRDVLDFVRAPEAGTYDLVFVDPPYDSALRLAGPLSGGLPSLLTDGARIVTESDKRSPLILDLPLVLERTYGDTRIAVHHA